jgi:hypothetical protein
MPTTGDTPVREGSSHSTQQGSDFPKNSLNKKHLTKEKPTGKNKKAGHDPTHRDRGEQSATGGKAVQLPRQRTTDRGRYARPAVTNVARPSINLDTDVTVWSDADPMLQASLDTENSNQPTTGFSPQASLDTEVSDRSTTDLTLQANLGTEVADKSTTD